MTALLALRTMKRTATTLTLGVGMLVSLAVNPGSASAAPTRAGASPATVRVATAPAAMTPAAMAGQMLALLNAERVKSGRAPLRMNVRLIRSAHGHNLKMAAANRMSHLLPGEAGFLNRLLQVGYRPRGAAENIGWNSNRSLDGVLYLQRVMYNERAPIDGHRVNILNRTYREIGVDVYQDAAHRKVWITQDFGLAA